MLGLVRQGEIEIFFFFFLRPFLFPFHSFLLCRRTNPVSYELQLSLNKVLDICRIKKDTLENLEIPSYSHRKVTHSQASEHIPSVP